MPDVRTPCQLGDPDDWFIDAKDVSGAGIEEAGELMRRRAHAIHLCHHVCPKRLGCLTLGLRTENLPHGTWGGYTADQRQTIVTEAQRKRKLGRNPFDEELQRAIDWRD